jgi:hypothetical protein
MKSVGGAIRVGALYDTCENTVRFPTTGRHYVRTYVSLREMQCLTYVRLAHLTDLTTIAITKRTNLPTPPPGHFSSVN